MRLICQGRTVIIIAHRLAAVRHCDRIITIENGHVTEDGSHADLITQEGFYKHLWQAQAVS
jgi:ABC-type multidrug transport system fused ATPase/permease subunit